MGKLRTSDEWQELCRTIVFDPDGWDRSSAKGFQFTWYEEQITRKEFEKRLCISTCQWELPIGGNIWRDKEDEC